MKNILKKCAPYQILFPIGLLHAALGGLFWLHHVFFSGPYPGALHAHHMLTGFLLSFIAGFLLTAIPKFIGTDSCTSFELFIPVLISLLSVFFQEPIFAFLMYSFLALFLIRRFSARSFSPPPHFIFLPIGILLGIAGSLVLTCIRYDLIDSSHSSIGRVLFYYGSILAFLLGIGAKLVTALLGWGPLPTHQIQTFKKIRDESNLLSNDLLVPCIQSLLFIFGVLFEAHGEIVLGRILRSITATWIAIGNWKIYRLPKNPSRLAFWIWIACWILVLGLWTSALFPSLGVHASHLIFIGGYGLMTLMISTRVTLAHGGYSTELESRSHTLTFVGVITLLAMLTRFTAPWTHSYLTHLVYAGITWVVALSIWGAFIIPKILRTEKN